jgi:hypothetical protein
MESLTRLRAYLGLVESLYVPVSENHCIDVVLHYEQNLGLGHDNHLDYPPLVQTQVVFSGPWRERFLEIALLVPAVETLFSEERISNVA